MNNYRRHINSSDSARQALMAWLFALSLASTSFAGVLVPGNQWLGGQGVDVMDNCGTACGSGGNSYVNGTYVGIKWQCVELAQRLYYVRGWWSGMFPGVYYAYEIYAQASAMGMTRYSNGSGYVPVPGDMIVFDSWSGNPAGHVAVVDYVDSSHVHIVEENWSTNGRYSLTRSGTNGSLLSRGSYPILGVVHSPHNGGSSGVAPMLTSPPNYTLTNAAYLDLRYKAVPGATKYNVQVAKDWGFTQLVKNDTTTALSVRFNFPAERILYRWRVRAMTSGQWGPFSSRWTLAKRPAYGVGVHSGETRNMLTDADAEFSLYRNWGIKSAGLTNPETPGGYSKHRGAFAFVIFNGDATSNLNEYIYQSSILAVGGANYTFSGYVYSVLGSPSHPNLRVALEAYDSSGRYITSSRRTYDDTIDSSWVRVSHTYPAPSGTRSLKVIIYNKGSKNSPLVLDQLQLEPGSTATAWTDSLDCTLWSPYPDDINLGGSIASARAVINARDWGLEQYNQDLVSQTVSSGFTLDLDIRRAAASPTSNTELARIKTNLQGPGGSSYDYYSIRPPSGDTGWHHYQLYHYPANGVTELRRDGTLIAESPLVVGSPPATGRFALSFGGGFDFELSHVAMSIDTTPPTFAGLLLAMPDCSNGSILLSYGGAGDSGVGFKEFRIYRSGTAGQLGTLLGTTTSQTYSDTAVTLGTTYFYTVRAVDRVGNEDGNMIQRSAAALLNGVSATDLNVRRSGNDVVLDWTPIGGSDSYIVYRSENPANLKTDPTATSFPVAAPPFTDTAAVSLPQSFYYAVEGFSSACPGSGCIATGIPSTDWRGEYYANMNLSGNPSLVRDDGAGFLSLDFGTGSPSTGCGIPSDYFSARFTRIVSLGASNYRFFVRSDNGYRLWIDGRLYLDRWTMQVFDDYVDVALASGVHTLVVAYFEGWSLANISVSWYATGAGCNQSVPGGHFKGEYFGNTGMSGTPLMVRDDGPGPLAFNWGTGSPSQACGVPSDGFSARYTGTFYFGSSGNRRFFITSDDGVRLYLDGSKVLDRWYDHGALTDIVNQTLGKGNHTIRMDYYERTAQAVAKLSWAPYSCSRGSTFVDIKKAADVNGDHRDEFVRFFPETGRWDAALSSGHDFQPLEQWVCGHGIGSTGEYLGDLNGDGMADSMVFFEGSGMAYAAYSRHGGFDNYKAMTSQPMMKAMNNKFLADVNGDGKEDFVGYRASSSNWYVALSSGSSLAHPMLAIAGYGIGSQRRLVGDVTGDGRADAVVVYTAGNGTGIWYVAKGRSDGKFSGWTKWASGHGSNADDVLLGDVNGDGRKDAITFWRNLAGQQAAWIVWNSTGSSFTHDNTRRLLGYGYDSNKRISGDFTGDGRDDIGYYLPTLGWYVAVSTGYYYNAGVPW